MTSPQSLGGKARALALSSAQRREIASKAAQTRWKNTRDRIVMGENPDKKPDSRAEKPLEPKGVIAILTGPDGYVWATEADFNDYGGGKRDQEYQAKITLACKFIEKTCNAVVAQAIAPHVCWDIVEVLIRKDGFRRTIKYIGYKEGSDK